MNTLIEAAFLAAVSSLPGLSGIQYLSGVSAEESTVEGSAIIVHCPDCEHTVGALWKATIRFRLETPAFEGDTAGHDARLNTLRQWLDQPLVVGASTRMSGLNIRGYFVRKSQTSLEHSRWVAEIELVAGVDTASGG
jgi:hypothetical protein